MRYPREHKPAVRERIVHGAARLMRRDGPDGASVAAVMSEAGLSHGGFYTYFSSKAALAVAGLRSAFAEGRARWLRGVTISPDEAWLPVVLGRYLNRRHRDDRANGCAYAALGADFPRGEPALRAVVTEELGELADILAAGFADPHTAREQALATAALCVGGITLARAVDDAELSETILRACRRYGRGAAQTPGDTAVPAADGPHPTPDRD
jgi:TetR/AcrR family transcriptional repressor of nem operon